MFTSNSRGHSAIQLLHQPFLYSTASLKNEGEEREVNAGKRDRFTHTCMKQNNKL